MTPLCQLIIWTTGHTEGLPWALRQAWERDDADKAERLLRNLARNLEQRAPGVAASILGGLDEILTVIRLGLPAELPARRPACTNIGARAGRERVPP
jgi:putative transposase